MGIFHESASLPVLDISLRLELYKPNPPTCFEQCLFFAVTLLYTPEKVSAIL